MPVKLKPSVVKIDRQTKKKSIEHTYAKTQSKEELFKICLLYTSPSPRDRG